MINRQDFELAVINFFKKHYQFTVKPILQWDFILLDFIKIVKKISIIFLCFEPVLCTLTHFQSNRPGCNPKFICLDCNLKVTTRQILTRLNILGCNPLGWKWVEFKKSKIPMYGLFVNQNSTGLKKQGCNLLACNRQPG
jgi:hypothetical protein